MNFKKLFVLLLLAFSPLAAVGAPIATCSSQAKCLTGSISECDALGQRTVCLEWNPNPECQKAQTVPTDQSVSHACPQDGPKIEPWLPNDPICVSVIGGDVAGISLKDGRGCAAPGSYLVDGFTDELACQGPGNYCEGNNQKECLWLVETPLCETPPDPCLGETVCEVDIPCVDENDCPCDTYKFVG